MKIKGENELLLFEILNKAYPGKWEKEHKGINGRKFRFDCANVADKIAVEIEGGIWMPKGAHNTGIAMSKDMEKYNLAVLEGWRILRYTPETLRKRQWQIIRDIRTLCGYDAAGQTMLCLDDCSTGLMQIQQRL